MGVGVLGVQVEGGPGFSLAGSSGEGDTRMIGSEEDAILSVQVEGGSGFSLAVGSDGKGDTRMIGAQPWTSGQEGEL